MSLTLKDFVTLTICALITSTQLPPASAETMEKSSNIYSHKVDLVDRDIAPFLDDKDALTFVGNTLHRISKEGLTPISSLPIVTNQFIRGSFCNGNYLVTVAEGDQVYISQDAISWELIDDPTYPKIWRLTCSSIGFVAMHLVKDRDGNNQQSGATSIDGKNWEFFPLPDRYNELNPYDYWNFLSYADGKYVLAGQSRIAWSGDAINWNLVNIGRSDKTSLTWGIQGWLLTTVSQSNYWTSKDAITWKMHDAPENSFIYDSLYLNETYWMIVNSKFKGGDVMAYKSGQLNGPWEPIKSSVSSLLWYKGAYSPSEDAFYVLPIPSVPSERFVGEMSALGSALLPNLGEVVRSTDGFSAPVMNFNPAFTWSIESTRGTGSISPEGVLSVSLLGPGETSVVTLRTEREKFEAGAKSFEGASLGAALVPILGNVKIVKGSTTVRIVNFDPSFSWDIISGKGNPTLDRKQGVVSMRQKSLRKLSFVLSTSKNGFNSFQGRYEVKVPR